MIDRLERIGEENFDPQDELVCHIGGITSAIGGVVGGILGSGAAKDAANAQQNAADKAINQVQSTNNTVQQGYQPYQTTGTAALNQINSNLANGTGFASSFDPSKYINTDAYNFNLHQGQNGIQGSAAARGGLLSGGTAKALTSYASGLAANTYNQAYQNYLNTNAQNYQQLSGLAGLGLNSQNASAQANENSAQQIANLYTQQGNAQAAGIVGSANAWQGALGGITGAGQQYSLNNSIAMNPVKILGQVL